MGRGGVTEMPWKFDGDLMGVSCGSNESLTGVSTR